MIAEIYTQSTAERKARIVQCLHNLSLGRRPYTPSLPDNSREASVNRDTDSCIRKDYLPPSAPRTWRCRWSTRNTRIERAYLELLSWTGPPTTHTDAFEMGSPVVKGEGGRMADLSSSFASDMVRFKKDFFDFGIRSDLVG